MDSQEFFNESESVNEKKSLDEVLLEQRTKWTNEVTELNEQMKTIPKLDELLTTVYAKRQSLVDYYYGMNSVILKHAKAYRQQYNNMFNTIKINGYNGMRFTSDTAIQRQVECDLQEAKETIDLLTNQNNFIKETISTIDNIIFGIGQKIKVTEILNGLKF